MENFTLNSRLYRTYGYICIHIHIYGQRGGEGEEATGILITLIPRAIVTNGAVGIRPDEITTRLNAETTGYET
jgi:hypothetical protein